MMRAKTKALLESYYHTFNAQDMNAFLDLFTDDVIHDISQRHREVGKSALSRFIERANKCYREHVFEIEIMTNDDGSRAAAEFTVLGVYLESEEGMPEACGQTYRLTGGSFFEIRNGKIARVSNHYNMQDWLNQVIFQAPLLMTEGSLNV